MWTGVSRRLECDSAPRGCGESLVFAVSWFWGRCSKGTIPKCALVLVLAGIAFPHGNESEVWMSLKYLHPPTFQNTERG